MDVSDPSPSALSCHGSYMGLAVNCWVRFFPEGPQAVFA
jgi:hypothetical protein